MPKIGGEFDFNLNTLKINNNSKIKLFASGRHAFAFIIEQLLSENINHIYVPMYICDSIFKILNHYKYSFTVYNQNNKLEVIDDLETCKKSSAIFFVNYFGFNTAEKGIDLIKKVRPDIKIVVDNVQSYYRQIINDNIDYQFNSLRKTFSVPDGAAVLFKKKDFKIAKNIQVNNFHQSKVIASIFKNNNFPDNEYLFYFEKGEEILNSFNGIELSSDIGLRLFNSIDHSIVKNRRKENSRYVYKKCKTLGIELLFDKLEEDTIPLCVPVLFENREEIRKKLFLKKIYLPIHWPENDYINADIQNLMKRELSIVIDQRYSLDDMKFLMDSLSELL